jgi:hypothetical protein
LVFISCGEKKTLNKNKINNRSREDGLANNERQRWMTQGGGEERGK